MAICLLAYLVHALVYGEIPQRCLVFCTGRDGAAAEPDMVGRSQDEDPFDTPGIDLSISVCRAGPAVAVAGVGADDGSGAHILNDVHLVEPTVQLLAEGPRVGGVPTPGVGGSPCGHYP